MTTRQGKSVLPICKAYDTLNWVGLIGSVWSESISLWEIVDLLVDYHLLLDNLGMPSLRTGLVHELHVVKWLIVSQPSRRSVNYHLYYNWEVGEGSSGEIIPIVEEVIEVEHYQACLQFVLASLFKALCDDWLACKRSIWDWGVSLVHNSLVRSDDLLASLIDVDSALLLVAGESEFQSALWGVNFLLIQRRTVYIQLQKNFIQTLIWQRSTINFEKSRNYSWTLTSFKESLSRNIWFSCLLISWAGLWIALDVDLLWLCC